jgi:glycerol kinase
MISNKNYILAIDQSTSATKVMLFNRKAELVHRVSLPHRQYYPRPGFVEHDAEEIFRNTVAGMLNVVAETGIKVTEIAAVSITNQRETALIWNATTGKPVANAAVWQCQRGADFCNALKDKGLNSRIQEKTGLIIDPYFSASKLRWMVNNLDGMKEKAAEGKLLWGTIDSWLLWKLTGGKVHATDFTNACRTLLFNINTLTWDDELKEIFELKDLKFPDIRYSDDIYGYTEPSVVFNEPLPVSGLTGDSHGAFFGQQCFIPGVGKATYGTGSSVMMNTGTRPLPPPNGLVTSVGYGTKDEIAFVYEGNIHCTGDTISWLKNEMQLIKSASESEELAVSVSGNNGVYLVPAFVGLGAPYWDNGARACISGMGRDTTKAHVVRAALESIAYQVKDLANLMGSGGEINLSSLRVDGGATRNNFLMQFQADILPGTVERSDIEEISALGSAFLAGLGTGFWKDREEIKQLRKSDRIFIPAMPPEYVDKLYGGWKSAVAKSQLK